MNTSEIGFHIMTGALIGMSVFIVMILADSMNMMFRDKRSLIPNWLFDRSVLVIIVAFATSIVLRHI